MAPESAAAGASQEADAAAHRPDGARPSQETDPRGPVRLQCVQEGGIGVLVDAASMSPASVSACSAVAAHPDAVSKGHPETAQETGLDAAPMGSGHGDDPQRHRTVLDARAILANLPSGLADGQPPAGAQPVSSGGRQAAWYVSGMFGDAVLRQYRRGGLVAHLVRQTYLWQGAQRTRGFAELRVMAALHARGLPVPRPLAASYRRKAGLFYEAAILTQRIPDVRTLAQALRQASPTTQAKSHGDAAQPASTPESLAHDAVAQVRQAFAAQEQMGQGDDMQAGPQSVPARVAAAIVGMHDAGVWHADLNAHNILLDAAGKAWLIDFDRARDHGAPLSPALRVANMQRLRRSLEKVAGEAGIALWRALDRAYAGLNQGYADSLPPS